jgi:hypothetical protein
VEAFEDPEKQSQATRQAMDEAGLPIHAVWMRYFSFTGSAGEYEVDAYLNGSMKLPTHERDLVAHAVNELIKELPPPRMAPYSSSNGRTSTRSGNSSQPQPPSPEEDGASSPDR